MPAIRARWQARSGSLLLALLIVPSLGRAADASAQPVSTNAPAQVPEGALPQQTSPVSPSSQSVPTTPDQQPDDIELTPENPAPTNPLPPLPKLELNTSEQFAPVLPSLNPDENALYEPTLYVKDYTFEGNHVYDSGTLDHLLDKYKGRKITSQELETAREIVTLYYVSHGYINSGALLPDQDPKDGIVHFQVVEGKLTEVMVTGNHWFQTWWLRNNARLAGGSPLNYNSLKQGLQVLRENPTISQVNGELGPAGAPGQAKLKLDVKDAPPFRISMELNNYRPPSIGSTIAELHVADLNLTGNNDPLVLTYGVANSTNGGYEFSGFDNVGGDYTFPVSPWRTTMEIGADRNNAGIIEAPFNSLNIRSSLTEYHAALHQAILENPNRSFIVSLQADDRRNDTTLLGQPFSLSAGAQNGIEQVFVLRFIQEFVDRSQTRVFSARSQFSVGVDALGATINNNAPDGQFFDWLGQTQYIQRLGNSDLLLIVRLSGQLADRPLLSLEQLELGGISSVRGYLENQALRDNGVLSTLEVRIPLYENAAHNPLVSLAPFADFGVGWNNTNDLGSAGIGGGAGQQGVFMPSAGIGLLFNPVRYINGQIYWGYGFNREQEPDGQNLQNKGVEFSLSFNAF
jgi:hemolysin activation/secretion protein